MISKELIKELNEFIKKLILEGFDTFFFGSKSQFDSIRHSIVTELKKSIHI